MSLKNSVSDDSDTLNIISNVLYYLLINRKQSDDTLSELQIGPDYEQVNADQKWFAENADLNKVSIPYSLGENTTYHHTGYVLKNENGDKGVAIICHGFHGNALSQGAYAKVLYDCGFSILAVDLRGHGGSDEERTNLGIIDSDDINVWVSYVNESFGDGTDIALYGVSLGSGVILQYISDALPPENIKYIIADSSYQSLPDAVKTLLNKYFAEIGLTDEQLEYVYNRLDGYITRDQGVGFEDGMNITKLTNIDKPVLFLHSKDDATFSVEQAQDTFERYPYQYKSYMWVTSAYHGFIPFYFYSGFRKVISDFIDNVRDNSPLISGCYEKEQFNYDLGDNIDLMSGVIAMDKNDGDITNLVSIEGDVDSSTAGQYSLTYSVTNSLSITSSVSITIIIAGTLSY